VRIERVEASLVSYPWSGYFKFLSGTHGHRVVVLKITADNGLVGWGESLPVPRWSYEVPEATLAVIRHYYAPTLVGRNPLDIEGAHRAMDQVVAPSFSTGMPISRAGIDLALHDLVGKLSGCSVGQLWNRPTNQPIILSWTINVRALEEVDQEIATARGRGYHHFNVKIAPHAEFDIQLIRRIRQLVPDGHLWVDANCGYDLATALAVAPQLADAGVDVLEAPLRPNCISGYQALKRQGALPITLDEGVVSPTDAEEFIRLRMVDGLTIKVSRCGGLLAARRQIELVQDAGLLWLGSGLTDPDVSLAASLALFSAYKLDKPAALNGPQFLTSDILREPLHITGDVAHVPTGAGLGVDVDEAKLAALLVTE
jgi:L-alanine-DL-glutamate epimerase-like enolase superfamily enzyme